MLLILLTACIYRLELKIENGISSTQTVEYAYLPKDLGAVLDLKFMDDEQLMLVVSKECKLEVSDFVTRVSNLLSKLLFLC